MLRRLQVVALILLGGVVAELALWAELIDAKLWFAVASALIAYISLLSPLLLGKGNEWKNKALTRCFNILLGTRVRTSLVLIAGLTAFAIQVPFLWRAWLRITAFSVHVTAHNVGQPHVKVFLKDLMHQSQLQSGFTNDEGFVTFRAQKGDFYQVGITDGDRSTLLPAQMITELPKFVEQDVAVIPPDYWNRDISFARIVRVKRFQAPTRSIGDAALAAFHLPSERASTGNKLSSRDFSGLYRDPDISVGDQAAMQDYAGTGLFRGHLRPLTDLLLQDNPEQAREARFATTVAPRTFAIESAWAEIEAYARRVAQHYEVWVISGTGFRHERSNSSELSVIGAHNVAVPDYFFQILLRRQSNGQPEALAFLLKNQAGEGSKNSPGADREQIAQYLTSVNEIKAQTGLDLLPALFGRYPAAMANTPESLWQ